MATAITSGFSATINLILTEDSSNHSPYSKSSLSPSTYTRKLSSLSSNLFSSMQLVPTASIPNHGRLYRMCLRCCQVTAGHTYLHQERKELEMVENIKKGRVCVTGGTGFLGSWMVKRLLEDGYSVNTTIRIDPENKRDISYLTNLPGASERLQIFNADLDKPDSFAAAFEGCIGVFHSAHPLDFEERESEEIKIQRVVNGIQGILQACHDSKTVKRVVYTSSISAVAFNRNGSSIIDESSWTDVDLIRSFKMFAGPYTVTKTLTDRAAQEFAEKNGLDLVTVIPTWINGPFICPRIPDSVHIAMALIFGDKGHYEHITDSSLVHVDDVARAHIFLFEHPNAKGRYICSAVEFTIDKLSEFISARYPQYQMPTPDSWKDVTPVKLSGISTKKLMETGFKYENGLEEMFDGAIESCKQKGLL